jgi:hypothetical protein
MRCKLMCSATIAAIALVGCGGSNTQTAATIPTAAPVLTSSAPLVVSGANPSTVNGTINKTLVAGLYESGVSDSTGNFNASSTNDYCRVAVYQMANTGDAKKYKIEVTFSKAAKAGGIVNFGEDAAPSTFTTRAAAPIAGVTVDVSNRRIVFSNTTLTGPSGAAATLNGSLEYPTNSVVADQGNCG